MRFRFYKSGFTLIEVVVASVIGLFIMLVAVSTLRTVSAGRERIYDNTAAADELRFAANLIRCDFANLYRDKIDDMKLEGGIGSDYGSAGSSVTFWATSTVSARTAAIEGDLYEIQYLLQESNGKQVLMRRLCPIVGSEEEGELAMGVMTAIAENILAFELRYFDGDEWLTEWTTEDKSIPGLIEVSLAASMEHDPGRLMSKTFFISFPRLRYTADKVSEVDSEGEDEVFEVGAEGSE